MKDTRRKGLRLADDHNQALTARDRSIQEIAFEHWVVLGSQGYDHRRELRALALVDRARINKNDLVQLPEVVLNLSAIETGDERASVEIDAGDRRARSWH